MIDPSLYLAYVASVVILMTIPGPNVALIVANSVAHGPRFGLLTVAGTSAAMIVQLALTAAGMAELLGRLGVVFGALRWIGAGYLIYLGLSQWRAEPVDLGSVSAEPKSVRAIFVRAMLVSLTNPKTLVFYGAFFPQFIDMDRPLGGQVALLSSTFVALAVLIDSMWALVAGRARTLLLSRGRLRNRLSGGVLMGAGAVLAAARPK